MWKNGVTGLAAVETRWKWWGGRGSVEDAKGQWIEALRRVGATFSHCALVVRSVYQRHQSLKML